MDYIRLWAALSIVYGHSTHWLSVPRMEWFEWVNIFPGLILLFVLSGYLVAASVEHTSGRAVFLWRRFIRMYPALWVAFAVSAVAVAIMTHLYDIPVCLMDWVKWIVAQLSVFQFYTPPGLKAYGIGNPNGSLWMIPLQLVMYVAIMLTYKTLKRWRMYAAGWLGRCKCGQSIHHEGLAGYGGKTVLLQSCTVCLCFLYWHVRIYFPGTDAACVG